MATITSPRPQSPAISTPRITSPSLNDTPTSSVRPSVDLQRDASPAPSNISTSGPTPQRRNRAALRDYYKLQPKTHQAAETGNLSRSASVLSHTSDSTTTTTTSTSAQLSSHNETKSQLSAIDTDPSFSASAFIADILSKSSLRDILRVEATLVSEIRNLDGERKSLVYDNYSKLIKAVGTIGEMQRGMRRETALGVRTTSETDRGLDGLSILNEKFEGLASTVREMTDLEGNGQTKEEIAGEREAARRQRDMRRKKELVRWVLGAPGRLDGLIQTGKRSEAEEQWEEVKKLLAKWENVEGTEQVKKACVDVMKVENEDEDEDEDEKEEG